MNVVGLRPKRWTALLFAGWLIVCAQLTAVAGTTGKTLSPNSAGNSVRFETIKDVGVLRNQGYATSDPAQSLDLYLPSTAQHSFPIVVFVHGGGWLHGDKADPECVGRCIELAKNGYAAASINYRLCSVAIWPAQIYDCKAAIRYLRAHAKEFNLDADHIGVWGVSAGGHLAAMLGTTSPNQKLEGNEGYNNQSSAVQAVCDWFGPTDLTTLKAQVTQSHIGRDILSVAIMLIGGPINADNTNAVEASPVSYVSSNAPPFLIMQGGSDAIVPVAQSQELADALTSKGSQVQLILRPSYGHGSLGPGTQKIVLDFFDLHLKPKLQ